MISITHHFRHLFVQFAMIARRLHLLHDVFTSRMTIHLPEKTIADNRKGAASLVSCTGVGSAAPHVHPVQVARRATVDRSAKECVNPSEMGMLTAISIAVDVLVVFDQGYFFPNSP